MTLTAVRKSLAIAGFIWTVAGSQGVAQGRDTLHPRVARSALALVRAPTIIAIGDTTKAEPPFSSIRAMVDSLGFAFEVFATPIRQVVDQPHRAVYSVPLNLTTGFVIITPGRRPITLYGFISADSLRASVLEYVRLTRSLERDRP